MGIARKRIMSDNERERAKKTYGLVCREVCASDGSLRKSSATSSKKLL